MSKSRGKLEVEDIDKLFHDVQLQRQTEIFQQLLNTLRNEIIETFDGVDSRLQKLEKKLRHIERKPTTTATPNVGKQTPETLDE